MIKNWYTFVQLYYFCYINLEMAKNTHKEARYVMIKTYFQISTKQAYISYLDLFNLNF